RPRACVRHARDRSGAADASGIRLRPLLALDRGPRPRALRLAVHLRRPVISYDRRVVTSTDRFAGVPEQPEAKRLLAAALAEGPAHAYLLHGPRGVGKTAAARAFASALLGDDPRAARERPTHPDLYVLERVGEMIRIDDIRELRHDLHMRPFEA